MGLTLGYMKEIVRIWQFTSFNLSKCGVESFANLVLLSLGNKEGK